MDELMLKRKFIDLFLEITKFGNVVKCDDYEVNDMFYLVDESIDVDTYFYNFEHYVMDMKNTISEPFDTWLNNLTVDTIGEKDLCKYELPQRKIIVDYGDNIESFVTSLHAAAVEFMDQAAAIVNNGDNIKLQYFFNKEGIFIGFYADADKYELVYPLDRFARKQLAEMNITNLTKAYKKTLNKASNIGILFNTINSITDDNKNEVIDEIMSLQKEIDNKTNLLHDEFLDSLAGKELAVALDKDEIEKEKEEISLVTINDDGEDVVMKKQIIYNMQTYKQLRALYNKYINVPFNKLKRAFNSAQGNQVNITKDTYAHIHDNILSPQECILYITDDSFGYSGKGNGKPIPRDFIKQFFGVIDDEYSKYI